MTEEELNRIEALANAATAGPWNVVLDDAGLRVKMSNSEWANINGDRHGCERMPNAALIAASREAVPALIAEVRRLRGEINTEERSNR